jgi:hypothetical protein
MNVYLKLTSALGGGDFVNFTLRPLYHGRSCRAHWIRDWVELAFDDDVSGVRLRL